MIGLLFVNGNIQIRQCGLEFLKAIDKYEVNVMYVCACASVRLLVEIRIDFSIIKTRKLVWQSNCCLIYLFILSNR